MAESLHKIEQQYEGQEHQFLAYQDIYIHFIYSFSWDISKKSWGDLRIDLMLNPIGKSQKSPPKTKGWKERQLHERTLIDLQGKVGPNYQPNLVTKATVLEKSQTIGNNITVLVPVEPYKGLKLGTCHELPVALSYTVRIFDNGSATCTFVAHIREGVANFENTHWVLHLAHNIDPGTKSGGVHHHLTNSFIKLPVKREAETDYSLFPSSEMESSTFHEGYCTLHDLFRHLLVHSPKWAPDKAEELFNDGQAINMTDLGQDFQSPFVYTVVQLERNSFLRFRKTPTLNVAREVASILCKLTLDNRYIKSDFLHFSEDYLTNVLPFNKKRIGLTNLCLDRRLFFMMSRRGAIALTASLTDIPSYFVIPSLLNLCEILRARWHLGNIVNIKLDEAIAAASHPNGDPSEILDQVFRWRALFALFFRDPVPFLFDGGSITEVAEVAERELWLTKLSIETSRKFETLDRLVQDLYTRKRFEDLKRWSGEKS